jgi:hypothetical protein
LDLGWDPNSEADLAGYRVHYGTSSGEDTNFVDVGLTTTYRLDNLLEEIPFYIALTAYDSANNESDFSEEVSSVSMVDNSLPVANDDLYSSGGGTSLRVAAPGVLGNDVDPEGDRLRAAMGSDPSNGGVVLNPDGGFTYTPTDGFSGRDSFTYRANDGTLESATATVTITVSRTDHLLRVSDIRIGVVRRDQGYQARAMVAVVDETGSPITEAVVIGDWTLNGYRLRTVSRRTDYQGLTRLSLDRITARRGDRFGISVIDVAKAPYNYDPAGSVETRDSVYIR